MTDPQLVAKKQDVDLGVLEDVVRNHLDDLLDFVAAIRRSTAG